MGRMKDLYIDEMERLHEIYRAEISLKENNHEADDCEMEVAQKEGRLESCLEEAQSQAHQISG